MYSRKNVTSRAAVTPKTSHERIETARGEVSLTTRIATEQFSHSDETVLYLGYGSNLAAETFLGKRGIRPLSQINVVVPSIRLTFDLPGIPYSEPCFGNCASRSADEKPYPTQPPYHKNAWKKGLVGVVYEVTKEDYAHIIATEGGGSSYHDVLVDCYVLSDDPGEEVPLQPSGTPFKAHTLYAQGNRVQRPDPAYAQPSPRYLKLILDGAEEHKLPNEYRHFLASIRTYQITTAAQRLGSFVFLTIWGPFLAFFLGSSELFAKPDGTYPKWFARLTQAMFTALWASYDSFFHPLFGDGERTNEGDSDYHESEWRPIDRDVYDEKTPLIADSVSKIQHMV